MFVDTNAGGPNALTFPIVQQQGNSDMLVLCDDGEAAAHGDHQWTLRYPTRHGRAVAPANIET